MLIQYLSGTQLGGTGGGGETEGIQTFRSSLLGDSFNIFFFFVTNSVSLKEISQTIESLTTLPSFPVI